MNLVNQVNKAAFKSDNGFVQERVNYFLLSTFFILNAMTSDLLSLVISEDQFHTSLRFCYVRPRLLKLSLHHRRLHREL